MNPPPRKIVKTQREEEEKRVKVVTPLLMRKGKCDTPIQCKVTPNRVTPSSAVPKVLSQNLKEEILGKYKRLKKLLENRKSREATSCEIAPSHDWKSNEKDTIMRGSIQGEISSGDSHQNNCEIEEVVPALPPAPRGPPKEKPSNHVKLDIVHEIKRLLLTRSNLKAPKFRFDITEEAAAHNLNLLKAHDFDLEALLNPPEAPSVTTYGSEFKDVSQLEHLLKHHPRWPALKRLLRHGSEWKLEQVEESIRKEDAKLAAKRGNHKSAQKNSAFLTTALSKEIEKGWELLLPASAIDEIPNIVLSPMGVAVHMGIQEDGSFAPKHRVTHDLSFPGGYSDQSINSRVIEYSLEPCMFGHALLRVIHRIVHLRDMHPKRKIWLRKDDAKSAYRRIHLNAVTCFQTAVQITIGGVDYILLALRLPFGGSPCPSEFCMMSDVITDIINDLLACDHWDPYWVHSKYVKQVPSPKSLPEEVPFAPALETSVPNMEKDRCSADVFIDDVITVGVDIGDNTEKIMADPCTVIHALAHATEEDTVIPRQDMIAADKNIAEGAPEEVKIILGWEINTRTMSICLPHHKVVAWSAQLEECLKRKTSNSKQLQSLLGRLEQVATIIPMFGHFLNNVRSTEIRATSTNRAQTINKRTREDLKLAQKFITKAARGVNLNLLTFRRPTHIYICDACEHGIGGFATHGRAWTWVIPPHLRGRAHINLLEFMAQLVSIWVDIIECKVHQYDCLLGMGDNTASMGWMRRANFRAKNENDHEWYCKQVVARKLATLVLEADVVLYRQWFRGIDNTVADSLSRDSYFLPHTTHQSFLQTTVPHQLPQEFKIQPIPNRISSFLSSTLLQLPVQPQRSCPQKPSELALGQRGVISSYKLESLPFSLRDSAASRETSSSQHLPKPPGRPPSLEEIELNWWREQSMPPSHMWHRPSGQTTGLTPDWTWTVKPASSSRSR